ncbi:sensor histidine kinase [Pseudoalteromonas 'SMAR']|uniref:sensor histidine kinase n=1 Tax=Pseudoalteromonas 'SMAR' TaxID=3416908 RepID=UPI003AF26227
MLNKLSARVIGYGILLLVGMWASYEIQLNNDKQQALQQTRQNVLKLTRYIQSEFARYQAIQTQLSNSPLVYEGLSASSHADGSELDRYLQDIQIASGASDVYLLNLEGTVIASSNWQQSYSYKGSNFAFRPYFYQTLNGQEGVTFALGQRSKTRGFYFAKQVSMAQEALGVVVMKVNASKFESDKAQLDTGTDSHFLLVDSNNVVLASDVAKFRLQALSALSAQTQQQLRQTQQFLGKEITRLPWQQLSANYVAVGGASNEFLLQQQPLHQHYRLLLLRQLTPIYQAQWPKLGITALLLLLACVLLEFILSKMTGYKRLVFSQRSLELEIAHRREELEQAQDALIRAAKLATIGQLSASINHEINQPLSAMSAYVASAKRLAQQGNTEKVIENMALVQSLITRVHTIVAQLKSFSQHHHNKMQVTRLQQSIDNALVIVGPELKRAGVTVQCHALDFTVWVDPFRFEQVLVNILSNACQAVLSQPQKCITLNAEGSDNKVQLSISDSGEGIRQHELNSIFEPFYTTKSGNGLGLGLSISKQIIESFQGQLSAHNHPAGGAEFLISLHTKSPTHDGQ